jgi:hypothetical protein
MNGLVLTTYQNTAIYRNQLTLLNSAYSYAANRVPIVNSAKYNTNAIRYQNVLVFVS